MLASYAQSNGYNLRGKMFQMEEYGLIDLFSWHVEILWLYIGFETTYYRPSRSFDVTLNVRIERRPEPTMQIIKQN